MRRALIALAAAFALLAAGGAAATSISPPAPHDPRRACESIGQLVADLNAGRLKDPKRWIGPTFYSDAFGEVEAKEEAAFLHSLRHSEGKPDRDPVGLYGIFTVHKHEEDRLYLVALQRGVWRETRLTGDPLSEMQEVHDPHYATDYSYWLATFWSNRLVYFREARELYPLMRKRGRLRCSRGPAR